MSERDRWIGVGIGVMLAVPVIVWVAVIAMVQR
jgi:hypothetical protein